MTTDLNRADAVIRNVRVFNSYFKRFDDADVYIKDGKFLYIDKRRNNEITAEKEIDGKQHYMIPGLIDIHMHIESSLVTPEAFARDTVKNGLTTIVSEPHEIANVAGVEGILAMIEDGKKSPYDCYYAIPSNVPIMPRNFETSGGTITAQDMKRLKDTEGILCLGEVMNFREIIRENDSEVGKFIDEIHPQEPNYPLEGHCPALVDSDLAKFVYLGIQSDHCDHDIEELKQRFENGVFIQLQDLMVTPEVIRYVCENQLYEYFSFVTDDTFPDILYHRGHVDAVMRKAISYGMRPEDAIYCTTYTPSRRMNLLDRGVIAPGRLADFVLLDDLNSLHIINTYKRGECIYDINDLSDEREDYALKEELEHTVYSRLLKKEDLIVKVDGEDRFVNVRVMEVNPDNNRTAELFVRMEVKNHVLQWKESGCALMAVVERHGRDNHIAYGFACGSMISHGAVASSYSHDSHNLIVMGYEEEEMCLAINRVIGLQGGITAVSEGKLIGEIALPIAGLLSRKSVKKTSEDFEMIRAAFDALGYRHRNNIMNFCLLSLTCIPKLKLTDRGYMDTVELKMVPLYEEIQSE
ncbi:MAG: adenine deaminase [Erysipelotrichaceae bacterium]|nr:adenine deaminase [Erysipelotrichaceae bacterium]